MNWTNIAYKAYMCDRYLLIMSSIVKKGYYCVMCIRDISNKAGMLARYS